MSTPYPTAPGIGDNWMIVDVETAPRDGIEHLLEDVEPAKNLKDPEKIKEDIAKRTAERDEKLALDYNLNRIVVVSVFIPAMDEPKVWLCESGDIAERVALEATWLMRQYKGADFAARKLIGFNIRNFDVPVLVQRTRLLGLPMPNLDLSKYSKEIVDIFELLTFYQGFAGTSAMRRRLKNYCTLFGIPQDEEDCDGRDVPALIAAGETEKVVAHCKADVLRTYELAKRIGVIKES